MERSKGKTTEADIQAAKTELHADAITIEAQVYARSLYEKYGFVQTSGEFLEDGIPHVQMQLRLSVKRYICDNGKEGCVRETQEGCPLPLKSVVFETFSKFQKLRQRGEKTFSIR